MKISYSIYVLCVASLAACAQAPLEPAQKVTRNYEATGDSAGIHPYVYGKYTLIKFDGGKPFYLTIKDDQGASMGCKQNGDYCSLERLLDSFTVTRFFNRTAEFKIIQPQLPIVPLPMAVENEPASIVDNQASKATSLNIQDEVLESHNQASQKQEVKISAPIFTIMKAQLQMQRRLLDKAGENPNQTGQELFEINSRLGLIESKMVLKTAVVNVYFPFNGTKFKPSPDLVDALFPIARDAVSINLFGRTDSNVADKINARIADKRAVVAKDFLVSHGVSNQIIHTSSLAAGDNIAPNNMAAGRALNRRVTIEIITR